MPTRYLAVATSIAAMLLLLVAVSISLAAGMMLREASLTAGGMAYEVNADAGGNLFISDSNAGEIWQLKPATSAYTKYLGLPYPSDARPDLEGNIWWTDWDRTLGRINVLADTVTTWHIEVSEDPPTLGGLAVDEAGRVWVATHSYSSTVPALFRFDPGTAELCGYVWEGSSYSDHVLYAAGRVWLGDQGRQRIIRFDPAARKDQVRWWHLSGGLSPKGLALDGAGRFWWADPARDVLGRLDPGAGQATLYALPGDTDPIMLTMDGAQVWYSTLTGSVGRLTPALATGSPVTAIAGTLDLISSDCRVLEVESTAASNRKQGTLEWGQPAELTPVVDGGGWTVYRLPTGAVLHGIVEADGSLWVADNGRQKLVRLEAKRPGRLLLPLVPR